MSVRTMCNQTAEVWRATKTSDNAGGYTSSWAKIGNVKCRIWLSSDSEKVISNRVTTTITYKCVCLITSFTITELDQLRINDKQYEIIGLIKWANHHYEMSLIEYKPSVK